MAAEAGKEEMAISSPGRGCLAFDSLVSFELATLCPRISMPRASHAKGGVLSPFGPALLEWMQVLVPMDPGRGVSEVVVAAWWSWSDSSDTPECLMECLMRLASFAPSVEIGEVALG